MKLYITAAGHYVGTQADAKAEGKGWRQVEVPTDKAGLLDYLNRNWANNPADEAEIEDTTEIVAEIANNTVSYAHQAVAFEDAFAKMSLSEKLHYGALAMEAARDEL